MNMNKKDYEKIASCLNQNFPIPTEKDIEDSISKIDSKLQIKAINKFVNAPIKEGYTKSLEILRNKQTDYSGIEALKTTQGRAIAMMTVDYLNGGCSQEILCGIPLK